MVSRRTFLKNSALLAAGLMIPKGWIERGIFTGQAPPLLDPLSIPKYISHLLIPPSKPKDAAQMAVPGIDYYEIALRQFQQQILPVDFPATTVWGYGSLAHPETFSSPALTIEATVDRAVRVKWINQLVDQRGGFLPHLLPVDPTLHWANPPSPRDSMPVFNATPNRYQGPVPMVSHVHGAHVSEESDGYAEAWYLPEAENIPAGYERVGTWYEAFKTEFVEKYSQDWDQGSAVFQYPNDQPAAALWYHDHTLGMTRLNVYAGPAGFYILRGGDYDLPTGVLPDPTFSTPGGSPYEIPIAIQDRMFNLDGSLFYPNTREFFDGFSGPYVPESDIAPIWNPEFFGNTMMVNGRTWPLLETERRRYRFRFLNGCNSRFLILKLVADLPTASPASAALPFWQIGTESGFLPAPVELDHLLLGPAERADVIVDFSDFSPDTRVYLINEGPDSPFGGGKPGVDFDLSDPRTTGQVMAFDIIPRIGDDTSVDITRQGLELPSIPRLGDPVRTRALALNEESSETLDGVGPKAALLGIMDSEGEPEDLRWDDEITENPGVGDTEIWELHNFTMDAHPIHIHEIQFEVVERETFSGVILPPESWETGRKDTVIAYPRHITRIKALFDIPGQFVWHCHIVEHEDNEMMRPYRVGP